jgi:hypothetical protein
MAIFVFMMLIAPFDLLADISLEAIIFIILYLICFITGCLLKLSHPGVNRGRNLSNSIYNLSALRAIGLAGFFLKSYDIFISRGIIAAATAADARVLAAESDVGFLAMIASILIQFAYIPLVVNIGLRSLKLAKPNLVLDLIIFILPMLLSLVMLSRVSVIAGIVSIMIAYCITFNGARLFSPKIFLWGSVSLLGITVFSGVLFSLRLEISNYSLQDSILYSGYSNFLLPKDDLIVFLKGLSGMTFDIALSGVSLMQYYLHGIAEFFYLMDNRAGLDHGGGQIIFGPIIKGLSILSGVNLNFSLDNVVLRQGVFISHFGLVWVEFGWWALIFGGLLGYFTQSVMLDYRRGNLAALPLAVYLGLVVVFMPMADFLTLGRGNYLIIVLILYWLIFSRFRGATNSVSA